MNTPVARDAKKGTQRGLLEDNRAEHTNAENEDPCSGDGR